MSPIGTSASGQLGEQGVQAAGEQGAAGVDADDRQDVGVRVLLGDLVGDPPQRSPQIVVLEHDRSRSLLFAPSWPRGTGLKDESQRSSGRVTIPATLAA